MLKKTHMSTRLVEEGGMQSSVKKSVFQFQVNLNYTAVCTKIDSNRNSTEVILFVTIHQRQ